MEKELKSNSFPFTDLDRICSNVCAVSVGINPT